MTAIGVSAGTSETQRKKARYYYLEGMRMTALEEFEKAYEYYKKAYLTDTSYNDAANAFAMQRIFIPTDSLQSTNEQLFSLGLIRRYLDENPLDIYAVQAYSYLASNSGKIKDAIFVCERTDSLLPKETYILLFLADAYMQTDDYEKALKALDKYESREGKSIDVTFKKMKMMLAKGDTLSALNEGRKFIDENPTNYNASLTQGAIFSMKGDRDSTLYYFNKAEKINPQSGTVKMALANYYKEAGDSVNYDKKFHEALISEDFDLEDKLTIMAQYLQTLILENDATSRGDQLFEVLRNQYPHEPEMLDLSARYNAAKGKYKEAIEDISYAIDLDPVNENYWQELLRYQWAAKEWEEVMNSFDDSESHITPTLEMLVPYSIAATELKRFDKAKEKFKEFIQRILPGLRIDKPSSAQVNADTINYLDRLKLNSLFTTIGDLYYQEEKTDDCFLAYENALYFYPREAMTLNNYAYFLTETGGDLDKAEEMSAKSLEIDEDNPTFLDTYAWIQFKKGRYQEALEYQKKAIGIAERDELRTAEYYDHLGDILFMMDDFEGAIENWEKALDLEPENEKINKKVTEKTINPN